MNHLARATDFLFVHGTPRHDHSFFAPQTTPNATNTAPVPYAGTGSTVSGASTQQNGVSGLNGDDEAKPIDPKVEIARINTNIVFFNAGLAIAAVGIGLAMCFFVRSILKPPKGVHGGDSDGDMDSDSEEDEEEGSED